MGEKTSLTLRLVRDGRADDVPSSAHSGPTPGQFESGRARIATWPRSARLDPDALPKSRRSGDLPVRAKVAVDHDGVPFSSTGTIGVRR